MIKPIYGAASIGVVRVDSKEQLEKTYIRVQEEMSGAKIVDGALVQGTHPNEGVGCHRHTKHIAPWTKSLLLPHDHM